MRSAAFAFIPLVCLFLTGKHLWHNWFEGGRRALVDNDLTVGQSLLFFVPLLCLALVPCVAANLTLARTIGIRRRWLMLAAAVAVAFPVILELFVPGFVANGVRSWFTG